MEAGTVECCFFFIAMRQTRSHNPFTNLDKTSLLNEIFPTFRRIQNFIFISGIYSKHFQPDMHLLSRRDMKAS